MNDDEAAVFYENPENLAIAGPARKRRKRTDLEKLTSLLDEWKVPYNLDMSGPQVTVGRVREIPASSKVGGYRDFYTLFTFTPEGAFTEMGAWE